MADTPLNEVKKYQKKQEDEKGKEIEVPKSKSLDKLEQIWAHLEGQDFQFDSMIQDIHDIKLQVHENFKYLHIKLERIEKLLESILAKPIPADEITKEFTEKVEEVMKLDEKKQDFKPTKEKYIYQIQEETGYSKEEIMDLVKEKTEELKGLISEEGALFIIGNEYGVSLSSKTNMDDLELNIGDMNQNLRDVSIAGTITSIGEMRTYTKKTGVEGRLLPITIEDQKGDIRVTIWNDNVDKTTELKTGDVIILEKASCKFSDYNNAYELSLPDWGKITKIKEVK